MFPWMANSGVKITYRAPKIIQLYMLYRKYNCTLFLIYILSEYLRARCTTFHFISCSNMIEVRN